MTRTVDAIPIDAAGDHRPADDCSCIPIEGSDLLEPSIRIRIHRHAAIWSRPVPPPDADLLLWRSRERRRDPSKPW
jgi:hypothetical protein